jgi:hypothetical protein
MGNPYPNQKFKVWAGDRRIVVELLNEPKPHPSMKLTLDEVEQLIDELGWFHKNFARLRHERRDTWAE